jgi:hypothetical protein
MPARAAAALPPGLGRATTQATATTTGSSSAEAYDVALASASTAPAAIIQAVASARSPARTTSQVARAVRNSDIASKVANEPRCSTGPDTANSAAAKNPAWRPYRREVAAHSSVVAPSMNASDSSRAAASPPRLSASAPAGG